jgi:hypothetical protein
MIISAPFKLMSSHPKPNTITYTNGTVQNQIIKLQIFSKQCLYTQVLAECSHFNCQNFHSITKVILVTSYNVRNYTVKRKLIFCLTLQVTISNYILSMCIMVFEANLPGIHWKCQHIKARDTEMLTAFDTTQEMSQNFYMYFVKYMCKTKNSGFIFELENKHRI